MSKGFLFPKFPYIFFVTFESISAKISDIPLQNTFAVKKRCVKETTSVNISFKVKATGNLKS